MTRSRPVILRRIVSTLSLACASLVSAPALASQTELEELLDAARGQMTEQVQANSALPGASLRVYAPRLNIDWSAAAGSGGPNPADPFSVDHPIRISSVTKPFVAAAVLRLSELGQIDIQRDIESYLPMALVRTLQGGGYDTRAIKVWHLLTHTSGIPDVFFTEAFETYIANLQAGATPRYFGIEDLVALAMTASPTHSPGAQQHYSDTGYILLGAILENTTGLTMAAATRRHSGLDRLQLGNTWWEHYEQAPESAAPRAQQFFGDIEGDQLGLPPFDLYGGGGMVSSASDLAVYFRALLRSAPFDHPATIQTMMSEPPQRPTNVEGPTPLRHGLQAWLVNEERIFGHGGWWGVVVFHAPDADITVVMNWLQQHAGEEMTPIARNLMKGLLEHSQPAAQ